MQNRPTSCLLEWDYQAPQDYVGLPRKEEEYVMAAHKLGGNMEMGIWININGWQGPIFAEAVPFGEWHHYAVTYNGKKLVIYLDGKESANLPLSGKMNQTGAVLHISNSCCGGRFMEGIVDEFLMANHAMSEAEIDTYAKQGVAPAAVSYKGKLTTTWGEMKNHH